MIGFSSYFIIGVVFVLVDVAHTLIQHKSFENIYVQDTTLAGTIATTSFVYLAAVIFWPAMILIILKNRAAKKQRVQEERYYNGY